MLQNKNRHNNKKVSRRKTNWKLKQQQQKNKDHIMVR